MNGVKCAMTAFMIEREQQILQERISAVANRDASPEAARRFLLLYGAEYKSSFGRTSSAILAGDPKVIGENKTGIDNEFNPFALNTDKAKNVSPDQRSHLCLPSPEDFSRGWFSHWDGKNCVYNVPHPENRCTDFDPQEPCPEQIGFTLWNYGPKTANGKKASHCVSVPDYSRFSLDPSQQASIQLTLAGSNQGYIFYDFINPKRLGPLGDIIAVGNKTTGTVFPKFDVTAKGSTTFDMSVRMPQTIFSAGNKNLENDVAKAENAPSAIYNKGAACKAQESAPPVTGSGWVGAWRGFTKAPPEREIQGDLQATPPQGELPQSASPPGPSAGRPGPKRERGKDLLTANEVQLVEHEFSPRDLFRRGCGENGLMPLDDTARLDYLALKDMLLNVVAKQNEEVTYRGGPEVALDTLTLTTTFQLTLDMSAGTYHIFRIFPMALPPQMGFKPDHTHTLKIVLHGANKRGDPQAGGKLIAACTERMAAAVGAGKPSPDSIKFCSSANGQLLEAIVEAVDQNKSSSSSGAGSGNQ